MPGIKAECYLLTKGSHRGREQPISGQMKAETLVDNAAEPRAEEPESVGDQEWPRTR